MLLVSGVLLIKESSEATQQQFQRFCGYNSMVLIGSQRRIAPCMVQLSGGTLPGFAGSRFHNRVFTISKLGFHSANTIGDKTLELA